MNATYSILITIITLGFTGGILLLLPRMARPTVPFGVRVPPSRVDDPAVRQATGQYYRGVVITVVAVIGASVAAAVVVPPEVAVTVAPFALLAAWFVPFLAARRRVQDAKRTENWFDGVRQTAVADTSMRTDPPRYPWKWAVPALVISVATFVAGIVVYPTLPDRIATHFGASGPDRFADTTLWSAFGLPFVQVFTTLLLLGLVAVVVRGKADLTAIEPHASADQYRRYSLTMARLVMVLAAAMNLTFGVLSLVVWEVLPATNAWIVGSMVPTLLATVGLVAVTIRSGQSGHRLPVGSAHVRDRDGGAGAEVADRDDDSHWVGGLIYFNRDDPALWVPKRFGGIGWTMNLARPSAWIMTVGILGGSLAVTVWALLAA